VELRMKYPILSVPLELWVVREDGGDGGSGDRHAR